MKTCHYFFYLIWPTLEARAEILQKKLFSFWEIWSQEKILLRLTDLWYETTSKRFKQKYSASKSASNYKKRWEISSILVAFSQYLDCIFFSHSRSEQFSKQKSISSFKFLSWVVFSNEFWELLFFVVLFFLLLAQILMQPLQKER